MNVVVVGAGAMGGLFSAIMDDAGADVSVFDVSEAVVEAINAGGVTLKRGETESKHAVRASTDPMKTTANGTHPDLVVFVVKAHHTKAAALAIAPIVGDDTIVLTIQNGWGNADVLDAVLRGPRMVVGVTYNSAKVEAPGVSVNTAQGATFVGGFGRGTSADARQIAKLFTQGGAPTEAPDEILEDIWKKLTLNAAALAPSALTNLNVGEMYASADVMSIVDKLAAETADVAQAQGLNIDADERISFIHDHFSRAGSGQPSMLQDARAKRKTEVEVINGAVAEAGERLGVPTPVNAAMVSLIHGLESGWSE
jgi:2-dehydropantoate 2-reductase